VISDVYSSEYQQAAAELVAAVRGRDEAWRRLELGLQQLERLAAELTASLAAIVAADAVEF
jgi:hypothetical protein